MVRLLSVNLGRFFNSLSIKEASATSWDNVAPSVIPVQSFIQSRESDGARFLRIMNDFVSGKLVADGDSKASSIRLHKY
jgi:hypothetical protein